MQVEALAWVLAEEERIGAGTEKDELTILAPLRAKLAELKKQMAAGVQKSPINAMPNLIIKK
jgi:hypothetical protein